MSKKIDNLVAEGFSVGFTSNRGKDFKAGPVGVTCVLAQEGARGEGTAATADEALALAAEDLTYTPAEVEGKRLTHKPATTKTPSLNTDCLLCALSGEEDGKCILHAVKDAFEKK